MRSAAVLLICCCIALLCQHHGAHALYSASSKVKLVDPQRFRKTVLASQIPSVVEFYAPWCGHCKNLAPAYEKVAASLHGIVNVVAVDCDAEANKPTCGQYGIQGFPTIKVFPPGKAPKDYKGPRTAKGIADAVTAELTDEHVARPTTTAAMEEFLSGSSLPKVMLYSNKGKTSTLYKSLSMRFHGRAAFAEVREAAAKEVVAAAGVSALPTLMVVAPDGTQQQYEGALKAEALVPFLSDFLKGTATGETASDTASTPGDASNVEPSAGADAADASHGDAAGGRADAPEAVMPDIYDLNDLDKLDTLLEEDTVWMIATYAGPAGEECEGQGAAFQRMLEDLGPLAMFGELNASHYSEKDLTERGLSSSQAPGCRRTFALKPFGEQSEPDEPFPVFTGNVSSAKEVQAFVLDAFAGYDVARLTEDILPVFMSTSPEIPKAMLFTSKQEPPPILRALAANLPRSYEFAYVVDTDKAILEQFNVKRVPFMVIAMVDPEAKGVRLQPYPGQYKYNQMHHFLKLVSEMYLEVKAGKDKDLSPDAAGTGTGTLAEVANNTAFRRECADKTGLCVVFMLDPASADFARQLGEARTLAGLRVKQPLHFIWVDAASQPSFAEHFGLQPSDAPAAVALAPKKLRFRVLPGSFSASSLDKHIDAVLLGRERTQGIQELPELVDGGERRESGILEEVEEFDLADLMAETIGGDPNLKTEL